MAKYSWQARRTRILHVSKAQSSIPCSAFIRNTTPPRFPLNSAKVAVISTIACLRGLCGPYVLAGCYKIWGLGKGSPNQKGLLGTLVFSTFGVPNWDCWSLRGLIGEPKLLGG